MYTTTRLKRFIVTAALILLTAGMLFPGGKKEKGEDPSQTEQTGSAESTEVQVQEEKTPINTDILARVGNEVVTRKDFDTALARYMQQIGNMGRPMSEEDMAELEEIVLQGLINRILLYQESVRQGYTVSDTLTQSRLDAIKSQFPDEEQYQAALASQNLTEKELKEDLKTGLSIQNMLEKTVFATIVISEDEILQFYNQNQVEFLQPEMVKASHILILLEPGAEEGVRTEAFRQIEEIAEILAGGADFAETAREFSQGPSSAGGGDLGFFERGQMVPEFEEAAFSLNVGDTSGIVETQFGLHIIKVFDRVEEELMPLESVRPDIESYLTQDKQNKAVESLSRELQEKAEIELMGS